MAINAPDLAYSDDEKSRTHLTSVLKLAHLFSTCVEAFGLIHASKDQDKTQQLLLTKLGLQQARLLIWGDVVGVHAPPPPFPSHFVPTRPGPLNPDPKEPVYFGVRDAKLDEENVKVEVEKRLAEIVERPNNLDRKEMMERYGLKVAKRYGICQPAFDTTRLESFREKYGLLIDLADSCCVSLGRGSISMTSCHWQIDDVWKFEAFIAMVKEQVDDLVRLMDVEEKVDRGVKMDIRSLVWHPESLSRALAARDMSKLNRLREVSEKDYPDYAVAADNALKYLDQEYKLGYAASRKSGLAAANKNKENGETKSSSRRPSFFSWLRSNSGHKRHDSATSLDAPTHNQQRTKSESGPSKTPEATLEPTRSMSTSAM